MAIKYVDSNVSSSGDGTSWAQAKKTLAESVAIAAAGDDIYVAHNHAEVSSANIALAFPGTAAAPVRVICVNSSSGAVADTATVTAGTSYTITISGICVSIGVTYSSPATSGIAFSSTSSIYFRIENGALKNTNSGSNPIISVGGGSTGKDCLLELVNSKVSFANASGRLSFNGGRLNWYSTPSAIIGTIPTGGLIRHVGLYAPLIVDIAGVDLSALGSNPIIVNTTQGSGIVTLRNCRLGSGSTVVSGNSATQGGISVEVVNCDSADTNYTFLSAPVQGTVLHETGIYRVGGFSDGDTSLSVRMASGANCSFSTPLELPSRLPIIIPWNGTPGSPITIDLHTLTNGVTLTDRDIWIEVEYIGVSGYTQSVFASDRAGAIASATNQDASTETWAGAGYSGVTTPIKQKLSVTVTPQKKFPIRATVKLARPNTIVLVCPRAVVS